MAEKGGSRVEIDATHGINIYGVNNAFTTRATKTGTIQCYVGADGKIYAGAGAVALDSAGITVIGGKLTLKNSSGLYPGQIYIDASGYLRLDAWARTRIDALWVLWMASSLVPSSDNSLDLGASTKRWSRAYFGNRLQIPVGANKFD